MAWIQRTLSDWRGIPSTKRHVIAASSAVLCLVSASLGSACAVWIWRNGDLGAGAVGALTFALGILAGLAGNAYRKPDGVAAPPAASGSSRANEPQDGSATGSAKTTTISNLGGTHEKDC